MPKPLIPVMPSKCSTCPFRKGSPYANLQGHLTAQAITTASRTCHNTGGRNAIHHGGTGKPKRICRGSRDIQLTIFHRLGVIAEPTDAAWSDAWTKMQQQKTTKSKKTP